MPNSSITADIIYICSPNNPTSAAAIFTDEGQKQIHDNIKIYKQNATCLMEALDKLGISYCGGKMLHIFG